MKSNFAAGRDLKHGRFYPQKDIARQTMVSEFAGQSLLLVTVGLLFIDLVMHSGMVIYHAHGAAHPIEPC